MYLDATMFFAIKFAKSILVVISVLKRNDIVNFMKKIKGKNDRKNIINRNIVQVLYNIVY